MLIVMGHLAGADRLQDMLDLLTQRTADFENDALWDCFLAHCVVSRNVQWGLRALHELFKRSVGDKLNRHYNFFVRRYLRHRFVVIDELLELLTVVVGRSIVIEDAVYIDSLLYVQKKRPTRFVGLLKELDYCATVNSFNYVLNVLLENGDLKTAEELFSLVVDGKLKISFGDVDAPKGYLKMLIRFQILRKRGEEEVEECKVAAELHGNV